MNYNPYAPPQAAPPPGGGPLAYGGPGQPWEIGEVLSAAFDAFKRNAATLILAVVVFALFILPFAFLPSALTLSRVVRPGVASSFLSFGCSAVNVLVQAFLTGGLVRITLAIARGQQASVGDLFSGTSFFAPMLGVVFATTVITILGCGCFGLIFLYMGLSFAQYFVVDQNMGAIAALQTAWRSCEGQRGQLLLFALVNFLLIMGGALLCGVGVFVAAPVSLLAFTIVYLRITGRGAPAPTGAGPGFGPPPGYGPPGGPPPGYGPPGGGFGGPPGGGFGGPSGGGYGPPGGGYGPQGGPGGYGGGRPPGY